MKRIKVTKVARSADGINVREGETYFVILGSVTGGYRIEDRVLKRVGEYHAIDFRTLETRQVVDESVRFCKRTEDCFYEREEAVKTILRRIGAHIAKCEELAEKWRAEAAKAV